MDILYSTQATAVGGRGGWVGSVDGALRVKLSTPKALGGGGGPGSNPEQLFAAAYAACFMEAIRIAAVEQDAQLTDDANVTATVGVGHPEGDPNLALRIGLSIDLAGMDQAKAQALVDRADTLCPYSRALREMVEVRVQVT